MLFRSELALAGSTNPKQVRSDLTTLLPLFTQTMFDVSLDRIRTFLQSDEYFDPKLTIGVLEEKYQCNIIVLVKDADNPEGGMLVPRTAQGYCHYRRDGPIIVVYCHIGSEKDRLPYPHCELLVLMDEEREVVNFTDVPMIQELESSILGAPLEIGRAHV